MNKRTIRNWATKALASVLAFSLVAESSIVGYASNQTIVDDDVEIIVETESYEEIVDVTEETSISEENSGERIVTEVEESVAAEEDSAEEATQEELSTVWEESTTVEEPATTQEESATVGEEYTMDQEESTAVEEAKTENVSEIPSYTTDAETTEEFVIEDGVLMSYNGSATDITIPNEVTEIAERVFLNKTFIKSVTFPSGLKKIGDFAFCGCSGLVSVTFNEGLETIGNDAFYGAAFGEVDENNQTVYGTVTIPSTVTYIGYEAFCNCTYLEEVVFSNQGKAAIEFGEKDGNNSMFRACKNLKKVTLPDRVVTVPAYAFQNCPLLEEVIFGSVTETIGKQAFNGCSSYKELICPDTLKTIEDYAFCGCKLESVRLNEGLETIGEGAFYGSAFGGVNGNNTTEYGTLTIPSTVTYIGYVAWGSCTYLGEVVFADKGNAAIEFGVKDGNNSMFMACPNLKKVTLANRVKNVPGAAFQNCPLLEEVTFGSATESIGRLAFNKCPSYKELVCPDTLKTIEDYAFSGCKLENIHLNEGLETIGEGAFYGSDFGGQNESDETIYGTLTIPSTVTYIGYVAFCSSTYLGEVVFSDEGTEAIEFGVKDGNSSMFMACPNLKKATLPERVKNIPGAAFQNCPLLEEVVLGNATESIGRIAFNKCPALKELVCPESLIAIEEHAFADCDGLVTISLNEGLQIIGQGAFYNAGTTGVAGSSRLTYSTLTIPSTVQEIGVHAFFNCQEYETVIFSNGTNSTLEFVGDQGESFAFQNCLNLKTVYLPDRLKELKSLTFLNCPKLETLYIPGTVEKIADNFLEYCDVTKLVIYGTTGSAAEKYATDNNITFIDASQLGIYAKSIQLNYKNLSFVGSESFGETVRLNATVLPGTAQNREVIYSSKDTNVATVSSTGVVTIVGYGETDILAVAEENANVFETCHVEVLKEWTASELNLVRQYIVDNNDFTVITNVSSNLQDDLLVQAGEGVTARWNLPYEIETGTHTYAIRLSKEGYESALLEDIPVTGVEITGISLNGSNMVQVNTDTQLSVEVLADGGEISQDDYSVEWVCANTNNVAITPMDKNPLTATITGRNVNKGTNLTARVYLKKDGNVISDNANDLGKTWFESQKKIIVTKDAVVDDIRIVATQNGNVVTLQTLNSLVDLNGKNTYELSATAYAAGKEIAEAPLTFKTSNSQVAKVKTDKSGKTVMTVSGKGTSVISVKAAKHGGYVASFRVTVKDSTPRLAQKTVTMNRYLLDAYAYVTIMPSDGYTVNSDSLKVVNAKDGSASEFEINKVSGYSYKITVKSGNDIKKGNYAVKILAKVNANEQDTHELPLTIKVTEQKPKVTIKQTAITPYRKDSYGVVEIITSEQINSMSYASSAGIGKARLTQKEVDVKKATIKVKADNVDFTNYKKVANKGTLTIRFEGYREEATYKKSIKLSVDTKLPVIKATPQSSTLYPGTLADTTNIALYNTGVKEEVIASKGYRIVVNTLNNYVYTSNGYQKAPTIQALKGATNGKLDFTITNTNWIDGISVKASCNLKIAKTPTLSFSQKNLVLNAAYTMGQYDAVSVEAYVKGFENIAFSSERTEIVGKNEKAQKVLDDGALLIMMEDGRIKAGITSNGYFTKSATYSYIVTAYSEKNMPVSGTLQIKICPTKSKASVDLKMKGSINLLDRENSYVLATPTIKNYTASVTDVELYGASSGKFRAQLEDGAIVVRAISGKDIKANTKYALSAYITLDSGVRLQTKITVTPKQKNPKLKQSSKSVVLFESARGLEYGAELRIEPSTNQVGEIASVQLASQSDAFGYSEGVIYVKDSATLLPNKTYNVKLAVTYKDHAKNAKPSYVTVKIDYRK